MLKRLYTGICLMLAAACSAQTVSTETVIHKELTAEKEFKLGFTDTSATKTVKVVAEFDSDKGYSFSLGKDANKKIRKQNLGKNLSFYVFEFVLLKAVEDSFKVGKALKPSDVRDVWELVWGLNNPNSSGNIAGKLLLANKIIVFDNYLDRFKDYDKRRALREKYINGRDAFSKSHIETKKTALIKQIGAYAKKYSRNDMLPFLYDSSLVRQDSYTELLDSARARSAGFYALHLAGAGTSSLTAAVYQQDTTRLNKMVYEIVRLYASHHAYLDSCTANSVYTIKNVEIQFERGFIEKIKVWVNYKDGAYIFENIYAIGFSSFLNYKSLSNIRLYIRNKEFVSQPYVYLSDVIRDYDNRLANYTRDYSPADTAFVVEPARNSDIVLNRESYINIFDAKIFTDLNGTKKTNPNGLFQIELNKRFNINTARRQLGSRRADVGYANYVNLFAAVNKIEQNNRYLTLHNANVTKNGEIISPNYATNIDFARYENYTAGASLNGALLDVPDGKFTLYADLGIKYAYLNIADSVITSKGLIKNPYYFPEAHTVTFSLPKITLELFSESRINVSASYCHNYTFLFSNNAAKQVVSYQKSDLTDPLLEKRARRSNVFELTAKLMPSKDRNTHVFARLRFYTQSGDANTSFSQIQIGYAYNWTINK